MPARHPVVMPQTSTTSSTWTSSHIRVHKFFFPLPGCRSCIHSMHIFSENALEQAIVACRTPRHLSALTAPAVSHCKTSKFRTVSISYAAFPTSSHLSRSPRSLAVCDISTDPSKISVFYTCSERRTQLTLIRDATALCHTVMVLQFPFRPIITGPSVQVYLPTVRRRTC